MSIVPKTARPTRQVRPTTLPARLRMARDAVQGALDAGAVVVAEGADALDDVVDVGLDDLPVEEHLLAVREARLRAAPEVEHHLEQVRAVRRSRCRRVTISGGSASSSASRSSVVGCAFIVFVVFFTI